MFTFFLAGVLGDGWETRRGHHVRRSTFGQGLGSGSIGFDPDGRGDGTDERNMSKDDIFADEARLCFFVIVDSPVLCWVGTDRTRGIGAKEGIFIFGWRGELGFLKEIDKILFLLTSRIVLLHDWSPG